MSKLKKAKRNARRGYSKFQQTLQLPLLLLMLPAVAYFNRGRGRLFFNAVVFFTDAIGCFRIVVSEAGLPSRPRLLRLLFFAEAPIPVLTNPTVDPSSESFPLRFV